MHMQVVQMQCTGEGIMHASHSATNVMQTCDKLHKNTAQLSILSWGSVTKTHVPCTHDTCGVHSH